ncbi:oxidoreductase [Mycobacterium shigaense]|uniref:Oxidoreductase n=1 Tax=Mycobacterium shigaense TaxID=722731 RepID=A0A1Z4EI47_9MYCO|nr:oxidoreductase [Mycobacterium shigaense]
MNYFSGGVAVITGAGSGIGAGLAWQASQLGMTVVLADADGAAIAAVRDEIGGRGGSAVAVPTDVRNPVAMQELADRTYRDVGPVRLLVNNAGVEQFGYLWDTPVANWQRVVDINVSGVFYGVRAFLPKMMAIDDHAWVWNLSSVGGVLAIPLQGPYITSKHAVLALTECLYLDVESAGHGHHIHVQAVLPGRSNPTSSIRRAAWTLPRAATSPPPRRTARQCCRSRPRPWTRGRRRGESSSRPPTAGSTCSPSRSMSGLL